MTKRVMSFCGVVVAFATALPVQAIPKAKPESAAKATLQHVTVTFRTISGKRLPDSDLVVDVTNGEDTLAASTAITPGVEFSRGSESGPWEIHLAHYTVQHKGVALHKDYVARALHEGGVGLGIEQARPADWVFDARVTFSFSDGSTVSGDVRACSFSAQGKADQLPVMPSKYGERVWYGSNARYLQWDRWQTGCAVRPATAATRGVSEAAKQCSGETELTGETVSAATDDERLKRTMADIRRVAIAIEAYAVDHKRYPAAKDLPGLNRLLSPTYIQNVPADAWGTALRVFVSADGRQYRIVSAGADRSFEPGSLKISGAVAEATPVTDLSKDIIYQSGAFVQWPAGR